MIDEKTQELRDTGEPTAGEIDEVLEEIIIAAARARSPDARPIIVDGDGAWEVLPVEKVPPGGTARFESTTDHELEVDRERLVEMAPFLAVALEVFDPSPTDDGWGPAGSAELTNPDGDPATLPVTQGTDERPFA